LVSQFRKDFFGPIAFVGKDRAEDSVKADSDSIWKNVPSGIQVLIKADVYTSFDVYTEPSALDSFLPIPQRTMKDLILLLAAIIPSLTWTRTKWLDHHNYPRLADCEKIDTKRVLVFVLEVAVGATACAGTILVIFAWTGAGL